MNATAAKILDANADDAATMNGWSDRRPATIVKRTATKIIVQEDRAEHFTSDADRDSGRAFAQGHGSHVVFTRDYDAPYRYYSLRKNGRWIAVGSPANSRGASLAIGHRSFYRDPSF